MIQFSVERSKGMRMSRNRLMRERTGIESRGCGGVGVLALKANERFISPRGTTSASPEREFSLSIRLARVCICVCTRGYWFTHLQLTCMSERNLG